MDTCHHTKFQTTSSFCEQSSGGRESEWHQRKVCQKGGCIATDRQSSKAVHCCFAFNLLTRRQWQRNQTEEQPSQKNQPRSRRQQTEQRRETGARANSTVGRSTQAQQWSNEAKESTEFTRSAHREQKASDGGRHNSQNQRCSRGALAKLRMQEKEPSPKT